MKGALNYGCKEMFSGLRLELLQLYGLQSQVYSYATKRCSELVILALGLTSGL